MLSALGPCALPVPGAAARRAHCSTPLIARRRSWRRPLPTVAAAWDEPSDGADGYPKEQRSAVPLLDSVKASALFKELTNTTELWKRGEVWFGAQLGALLLIATAPPQLTVVAQVVGVALVISGGLLVFLGQRDLGSNLSPLPHPREDHTLVTEGIYSLVRHPMYGGLLLFGLGWSSIMDDAPRFLFTLLLLYVLDHKAAMEEEQLQSKYRWEWERYTRHTKHKFIPYLW